MIRRGLLALCLLWVASAGFVVAAETVAILGTGRMGSAFGQQFARLGYKVVYGSRDPSRADVRALVAKTAHGARATSNPEAVREAGIVVLALPWSATETILKGVELGDKLIIDPVNALRTGANKQMEMAVDTSAAERIQALQPKARLVKAFNVLGSHVLASPAAAGGPVTIPLAGDDVAAKLQVAKIVTAMGFEAMDLGPLKNARVLEGMAILYMVPYLSGRREEAFEYYLRRGAAPKRSGGVRPAQ